MSDENPGTNTGNINISDISGGQIEVGAIVTGTVGGDIVNNITKKIVERALTAAEEADIAQDIARKRLAEGVQAYVQRIGDIAADDQDALQGGPYRGLKAYTLREAEIFFGRDEAMADLLSHLQRGRLTILHAESGAGKSSLLQAGIQYQLIVQGHVPLYVRPYDKSPALVIKQTFLPGLDSLPELAAASLRDYLHQVATILGAQTILVILIDQFEELFFTLNEEARQHFVGQLAACLEDEALNVCWVLALRTEFFGNLANFRPRIRNPFENDFRLNRLPREQAETVITEPARLVGMSFEPQLIEVLLGDLSEPDSGEVIPAQLQLVCLALYNLLRQQQQQNPDLPAIITLAMYEQEGRAEGILRGYLQRVLRHELRAEDRELARQLLIALVSSDQRRVRRTKSELAAILSTYLTAAQSLDGILNQLVDSRLLNIDEDEQTGALSYELAHDLLLRQIEIDPETQARKAAEELLKQEVDAFKRYNTLLSQDKFDIINSQREFLTLDDDAAELLRLSQAARRRAQLQWIGAIAVMVVLIVGVAIGFAYFQAQLAGQAEIAAQRQAALAAEAQAERDRAVQAEAEAKVERDRAIQAENTANIERDRANNQANLAIAAKQQADAEAARADAEAFKAIQARDEAFGREVASQAEVILPQNPQVAALLALEAQNIVNSQTAERVLAQAPYFYPPIITTLDNHNGVVRNAAWSPDGLYLASASDDKTAIIWNTQTYEPMATLKGHTDWVRDVAWNPDGTQLATASDDKTIKIWDVESQKAIATLRGHNDFVFSVSWNPDGQRLASGDATGEIIIWELNSTAPITTHLLSAHTDYVWDVAWSPDGTKLASASQDKSIIVWDLTVTPPITTVLKGHKDAVVDVAWNPEPDSFQLVSASDDRDVIIWDIRSGKPLKVLEGNVDPVWGVDWSPDGTRIASGSFDDVVMVWDVATNQVTRRLLGHSDHLQGVAWNPDSSTLASVSTDKSIILWDLPLTQTVATLDAHDESVLSAVWNSDGSKLATTSTDEQVILWENDFTKPQILEEGHQNWVIDATWSPDDTKLASSSFDGAIIIWDAITRKKIKTLNDLSPAQFWRIDWSPDGNYIVAGTANQKIAVWDVSNPYEPIFIDTFQEHTRGRVLDVAWRFDGKYLASGGDDGTVIIWDAKNWSVVERLTEHKKSVFSVAWSPDGKYLASGSEDENVLLWETDNWTTVRALQGHTATVYDIAWNKDGTLLATASGGDDESELDNRIIIWNVATGTPVTSLMGHSRWIWSVGWRPDGLLFTSASDDRTVKILSAKFTAHPCQWLSRNLTYEEWNRYFPSKDYNKTCSNLPIPASIIEAARGLARKGKVDQAIAQFEYLLTLDSNLDLNPATETQRVFEEAIQSLLDQAEVLAGADKIEQATDKLRQAKELDPTLPFDDPEAEAQRLAQPTSDNTLDAAVALAGRGDDETAKTKFEEAMELAASLNSAEMWHRLCVEGGRWRQAAIVLDACDNAIKMEPENGQYYNSRGIVRLQLGNGTGAREDFAEFEAWLENR